MNNFNPGKANSLNLFYSYISDPFGMYHHTGFE